MRTILPIIIENLLKKYLTKFIFVIFLYIYREIIIPEILDFHLIPKEKFII